MSHHQIISQMMKGAAAGGSYIAKSVVLDFADNHGNGSGMAFRSIDFFLDDVLIDVDAASGVAGGTSTLGAGYEYTLAFYTALPKDGNIINNHWLTVASIVSQRIWFKFNTVIEFDKVVINNAHQSGASTDWGCKNSVLTITEDTGTPSDAYSAAVTGGAVIFDGVFDQHNAFDGADDQVLTLI